MALKRFLDANNVCLWTCDADSASSELSSTDAKPKVDATTTAVILPFSGCSESDDEDDGKEDVVHDGKQDVVCDGKDDGKEDVVCDGKGGKRKDNDEQVDMLVDKAQPQVPYYYFIALALSSMKRVPQLFDAQLSTYDRNQLQLCNFSFLKSVDDLDSNR